MVSVIKLAPPSENRAPPPVPSAPVYAWTGVLVRRICKGGTVHRAQGFLRGGGRFMTMKRWILVAAILGSGIVFLDSSVVNVALPRMGRELPRSFLGILEGQAYVYVSYLLTLSALLILAGALTDFYGRQRMFLLGLLGFGVTSVLCG